MRVGEPLQADRLGRLGAADEPLAVAGEWRSRGGRVVGLFGRSAPRELVAGAGMLPVRLWPQRLARGDDGAAHGGLGGAAHVPEGLRGELSQQSIALLSALLGGGLDWIDALLIGRDSESHLKLFYVIRELAQEPEYRELIPPFAFSDVLRLPLRTSAVYNRSRLRQLSDAVFAWADRVPTPAAIRAGIMAECEVADRLRELDRLRAQRHVSAADALAAARAAEVLPHADALGLLDELLRASGPDAPRHGAPRVLVTGSEPEPSAYAALEAAGLGLVGDDHGFHQGLPADPDLAEPIGWLADRYQFSPLGAARAGLERVRHVQRRARELGVAAVLQLVMPDDEASAWELTELRSLLPDLPVVSVRLEDGAVGEQLRAAAGSVSALVAEAAPGGRADA